MIQQCDECGTGLAEYYLDGSCPQCAEKRLVKMTQLLTKTNKLEAANAKLQEENERYEEALHRIDNWAKAYPLKVFPKPDLKKAHKVLKAAGMTLDAISADAMRHVISGVKDIAKQALQ